MNHINTPHDSHHRLMRFPSSIHRPLSGHGWSMLGVMRLISALCMIVILSSYTSSEGYAESPSTSADEWSVEQWKVEFDRARTLAQSDRAQLKVLHSMIDGSPELAQVWFYGEVFSLATPNLPVQKRATLQSTLSLIASRLSEQGVHHPMLLLEETHEDQGGRFKEISQRTNKLQDRLFSQASMLIKFENRLSVCLELVGQDLLSESTYYSLLHRALLRTGAAIYMPNSGEELAYLRAALPLAECEILLSGDTKRWSLLKRHLKTESGSNTTAQRQDARRSGSISLDDLFRGGTLLEQNLKVLWEHWSQAQWSEAHEVMQSLIDILKAKRTQSARLSLASLYINKALLLTHTDEVPRSIKILERVIESFVEVDQPTLPTLLRLLLTTLLSDSGQWSRAQIQLELLLEDPAVFKSSRSSQRYAVTLTHQIVKAIETLHESQRDSEAINLFGVTLKLFSMITDDQYANLLLPSDLRKQDLLDKQLERANFFALTSRIYESSGQLDKARSQLEEARKSHPQPEAARGLILAWKLEQARLTLVDGGVEESVKQLTELSETLYKEQRRSTLASTALILSEAFHIRGSDRVAFKYANYGLELLSGLQSLKGTERLHAQLHASAAQALAGLGHTEQALIRLNKSLKLDEVTTQRFRLVWLQLKSSHVKLALQTLAKAESLPLQKQIIRGCIFAQQGRYEAALEALQAYTLTSAPRASIEGRMCLIYAHTMSDKRGDIEYVGRPLPSLMNKLSDPRYEWRQLALKSIKLAKRGRGEEAWALASQALELWRGLGEERLSSGWHLEAPVFALPETPLTALEVALDSLRGQSRVSADGALKIIERSRWLAQLERPSISTRAQLSRLVKEHGDELSAQLSEERSAISAISGRLLSRSAQRERIQEQTKAHAAVIKRPSHADLMKALSPTLQSMRPVSGAINWVFTEHNNKLYRFTLTSEGARNLKMLGNAKQLKTRLAKWEAKLSTPPQTFKAVKQTRRAPRARDLHYALWAESYKLSSKLLPSAELRSLISSEQSQDQADRPRAIVIWSTLSKDYSWGALVIDSPQRNTQGEAPRFLASLLPVFQALTIRAPSAAKAAVERPLTGRLLNDQAGTTSDVASRYQKPQPVITQIKALETPSTLEELVGSARGLFWSLPINLEGRSPQLGSTQLAWDRLPSTPIPSAASWVHFEHQGLSEYKLRAPLLALTELGARSFSWPRWSVSGEESIGYTIKTFSRGFTLAVAARFTRQRSIYTRVNLNIGGQPRYHPYFWAHTQSVHTPELIEEAIQELSRRNEPARSADDSSTQPTQDVESPAEAPVEAPAQPAQEIETPAAAPAAAPEEAPVEAPAQPAQEAEALEEAPAAAPEEAPVEAPAQPAQEAEAPEETPAAAPEEAPVEAPAQPAQETEAPAATPVEAPAEAPAQPDQGAEAPVEAPTEAPAQPAQETETPEEAPEETPTQTTEGSGSEAGTGEGGGEGEGEEEDDSDLMDADFE